LSGEINGKQQRFSAEYTMLSILEYLCINSLNKPVTKYHILTQVHQIKQQRPDRISHIMNILENNGFISSTKTYSNSTFYEITERGLEAYSKWVKDFLQFARSATENNNNKKSDRKDDDIDDYSNKNNNNLNLIHRRRITTRLFNK
jgi:DNA-binding PadR family transcriptional regulator